MELDKISINLRQRNPWEAMDLGMALMRSLWPRLLTPWLLLMVPVLLLSLFLQLNGYIMIGLFLLWLCKPVYDSLVLHVLSRGVFSDYPSSREIFSAWRQWLPTGVLTSLFIWRLSPARSFNMPVHQLEGLKGRERTRRLHILHKKTAGHAKGLTIISMHFEFLINLTLYGLWFVLLPPQYAGGFIDVFSTSYNETAGIVINSFFYWLSIMILEPFYVASGFSLYLNRRTQLEGWNIELAFRKIAQRFRQRQAAI